MDAAYIRWHPWPHLVPWDAPSLSLSLSLSLHGSLCLLSHIIGWGLDTHVAIFVLLLKSSCATLQCSLGCQGEDITLPRSCNLITFTIWQLVTLEMVNSRLFEWTPIFTGYFGGKHTLIEKNKKNDFYITKFKFYSGVADIIWYVQ